LIQLVRSDATPWRDPASWWPGLDTATADLDPPFAALSVEALAWNAYSLLDRAAGSPIRVASKSVRVRAVLDAVLALPGYHGILAYTLAEALWLAESHDDVVVGYPSVDRASIARLSGITDLQTATSRGSRAGATGVPRLGQGPGKTRGPRATCDATIDLDGFGESTTEISLSNATCQPRSFKTGTIGNFLGSQMRSAPIVSG